MEESEERVRVRVGFGQGGGGGVSATHKRRMQMPANEFGLKADFMVCGGGFEQTRLHARAG